MGRAQGVRAKAAMSGASPFALFALLMSASVTLTAAYSLARAIADFRARRMWWAAAGLLCAVLAGAWGATFWSAYL